MRFYTTEEENYLRTWHSKLTIAEMMGNWPGHWRTYQSIAQKMRRMGLDKTAKKNTMAVKKGPRRKGMKL